jgi:hypothetical protein
MRRDLKKLRCHPKMQHITISKVYSREWSYEQGFKEGQLSRMEDKSWNKYQQDLGKEQERKRILEDKELLERLADLEHKQWIGMMSYLRDCAFWQVCNGFAMGSGRWDKQIGTEYKDLSEEDKEKDRVWARKVLDELKQQIEDTK